MSAAATGAPVNGIPEGYWDVIVTGDARELSRRLPAGSIDLVFTDPVYERMTDYVWLAEESRRVLKPDGRMLCFCGIGYLEETMQALRIGGAPVKWTCGIYKPGASQRVFKDVFNHWCALLWCLGEPVKTMADVQVSQLAHLDGPHKWKKGVGAVARHLTSFALPGEVVWDPFCGGGTVEVACRMLGLHFVASEIDPATAREGQERLALVPEPLGLDWEPQAALEF